MLGYNGVDVSGLKRESDFASLIKYEAVPGQELRRDEGVDFDYHGRAPDGTPTATTAWEVVIFYKNELGGVVRTRYRTGVAWDDRASGWT